MLRFTALQISSVETQAFVRARGATREVYRPVCRTENTFNSWPVVVIHETCFTLVYYKIRTCASHELTNARIHPDNPEDHI